MSEDADQHNSLEISRYALALFDVLGFSKWIEREPLDSILAAYRLLIERAVNANAKGSLSAVQMEDGAIFAVIGPPHHAYFSDTILLWCQLVPPAVADFVERCADLICEALAMGIPLRGAIALGDAVLDEKSSMFIGKPIVEAAMLEKGQDWIGITLGDSAFWSPFLAQQHGASIIEYSAPMKQGYEKYASPIVLDWPRRWRDKNGECPSRKLRELNTDPAASKYWDNAIQFAEYSLSRHDWFKHPESMPADAILRLVPRSQAKF
jgi:hypothetical protein